jgi:DNA-binding MarR family transcriptional regulator
MTGNDSLLGREIQQKRPFRSRAEEAYLNVLRTSAVLGQQVARFLKQAELTSTQYNALRILRGAHPELLPCSEVGHRMVTPVPDVTRLLDRLEAAGLVTRCRDDADRRVVQVGITGDGLARLAELDGPLLDHLEAMFAPLEDGDKVALIGLLERLREGG